MKKFILKMLDDEIKKLRKARHSQSEWLYSGKGAFPEAIMKGICNMDRRIEKIEKIKEMFLKSQSK